MRTIGLALTLVLGSTLTGALSAQDVQAQLDGRVSPEVRQAACDGLGFLGLELDGGKNSARPVDQDIATSGSAVRILVIRAQEDWAIARECWRIRRSRA